MTTPANFVTRAQWGSTFNYGSNTRMPSTCKGVALHWEGTKMGTFAHSECDNKVRSIEAYHVKTKGWAGIAYNAVVCPHGYVFEGRGTRYRSAANGDVPKNNAYFAVCYLGGKGDSFTDAAKPAYIRAVQWLRADGGAGRAVIGHRDVTSTECPGAEIEAWLKATNFDGGTTTPPKPPARVTAVWGKPETWKIGSIGPDVTRLGQRLEVWANALGLPKPYTVGPSPEFTETDRRAVEAFQKKQGWTGADADGYPGMETFKRLAADPPKPESRFSSSVLIQNCASERNDATVGGSWSKRLPILADVILDSDASFIVCPELYAAQRPALTKAIASMYAEAAIHGGRVLYYRKGRWASSTGFWWKYLNGLTKPAVFDIFINTENGSKLTVSAWHTSYEVSAAGSAARRKEVEAGIEWITGFKAYGRRIYAGDFNSPADNGSHRPMGDDVEPVFEKHGYHDLGDDLSVAIGPGNYHLDRGFAGDGVKGERITVKKHKGSDHPATYIEFSY